MQVEVTETQKITITGAERLDAITVFLEDKGENRGAITIKCHTDVWQSYWGAMGVPSVAEFFCNCDDDYLCNSLSDVPASVIADDDVIQSFVLKRIDKLAADNHIEALEAAKMRVQVPDISMEDHGSCRGLMHELFDYDWQHHLPTRDNPEYLYICRIIQAVKQALQQLMEQPAQREVAHG